MHIWQAWCEKIEEGWGEQMRVGRLISLYGRLRFDFPAKFACLLVVEMPVTPGVPVLYFTKLEKYISMYKKRINIWYTSTYTHFVRMVEVSPKTNKKSGKNPIVFPFCVHNFVIFL